MGERASGMLSDRFSEMLSDRVFIDVFWFSKGVHDIPSRTIESDPSKFKLSPKTKKQHLAKYQTHNLSKDASTCFVTSCRGIGEPTGVE